MPIGSANSNVDSGSRDIIMAQVNESHAEKKRRREGEQSSVEEHILVGYTINNNPLAGEGCFEFYQ